MLEELVLPITFIIVGVIMLYIDWHKQRELHEAKMRFYEKLRK